MILANVIGVTLVYSPKTTLGITTTPGEDSFQESGSIQRYQTTGFTAEWSPSPPVAFGAAVGYAAGEDPSQQKTLLIEPVWSLAIDRESDALAHRVVLLGQDLRSTTFITADLYRETTCGVSVKYPIAVAYCCSANLAAGKRNDISTGIDKEWRFKITVGSQLHFLNNRNSSPEICYCRWGNDSAIEHSLF
jgi:hypothetical protein